MGLFAPAAGQSKADAFTQRYLQTVYLLFALCMPIWLFLGARGFAPAVGIAGLACLPLARPNREDWPGLVILLDLVIWAAFGAIWSPAENLHTVSFKAFTRLTSLHLAMQLVFCAALATATARLDPAPARRVLGRLTGALFVALAILVEEGFSHAAAYQAIQAANHLNTRPDMAVRSLAQAGYVAAVLAWPLGAGLYVRGRPWLALLPAACVPLLLVLMRGFAPTAGLLLSIPAFVLVYRFGRPAILGLLGLTVSYMLLTPLVMLILDHLGVYAATIGHLPPSWSERLRIWAFVVEQLQHHPLRGAGLDASRTFGDVVPLHPHNGPLQLGFELGVPGALMGAAFWAWLWLRIGARTQERLFAAVASAVMVTYLVISSVAFGLWQEWWIAVGGMAIAVCIALGKVLRAAPAGSPRLRWLVPRE